MSSGVGGDGKGPAAGPREATLFDLYRLASGYPTKVHKTRATPSNPEPDTYATDAADVQDLAPEESDSCDDDDSGPDSDADNADFDSCRRLGIKPDSFHEKLGVPTFRPTAEQFADFAGFIRAVEPWGRRRGLVKVSIERKREILISRRGAGSVRAIAREILVSRGAR